MSGHSKWSTIKRKKGALDAKRSKIFTKHIKEITIAARLGGSDPSGNPRLRRAIDSARGSNLPIDTITRAVKKGSGELEGVMYEELLYEGVGVGGALFMVEAMTDNRNRSAAELRQTFDKNYGTLSSSGTAAWAFSHQGLINIKSEGTKEDVIFEEAINAGAEDISQEGQLWQVVTARSKLDAVSSALEKAGYHIQEAALIYAPKEVKMVSGNDAVKLIQLFEALDDHDDVQHVYADFELTADALHELGD